MDLFFPRSNREQSPQSVSRPVGIDLGTTYSVIAFLDEDGRPQTLLNDSGDSLTPSAIFIEDGEVIVGREAVKASVMEPDSYAECFKRDMGGLTYHRNVRGVELPPEVLSGLILERLKRDAERRLGAVRQADITVPAFFDETRRRATQAAGRLAGLEVLDIINEPTAAALCYAYQAGLLAPAGAPPASERVLVYDLGGGTFDVTILEINGKEFRALATDGDVQLGGKEFDERLVNHIAERFEREHGVDPRCDPSDAAQLWQDVEEAKHALSARQKTTVICHHGGTRMRVDVTRDEFEELTRNLLERTETTTRLVVQDAGLDWPQISRVILVGGSSRMPMVADMLRRVSGKEPDRSQSPDEAVAHGAALYAGMLMQGADPLPQPGSFKLINVNSHSLGVVGRNQETRQRVNTILIPRNTPLPCQFSRTFVTAAANQRSVAVTVVEGESQKPEECITLGECVVRDLPSGLPAGTTVLVEYSYHSNGRISVSAKVPSIRRSAQVEIQRPERALSDLESWRRRLKGIEASPPPASAPAAMPSFDPRDQQSVARRLSLLCGQLGRLAVDLKLPRKLARSQKSAREAAAALNNARSHLQKIEAVGKNAAGRGESVRRSSELAQAKNDFHQAHSQAESAYLQLGEATVMAGRKVEGLDAQLNAKLHEIDGLRAVLDESQSATSNQ